MNQREKSFCDNFARRFCVGSYRLQIGKTENAGKVLVVYFSASGNTKTAAELIAAQTNADLFELELVHITRNARMANDFSDKTVVPFCSSSSSGLGKIGKLLADEAGSGNWLNGHRFASRPSENDVNYRLNDLGI